MGRRRPRGRPRRGRRTLDGLGVNYYNPTWIAAPTAETGLPFDILEPDVAVPGRSYPRTAFGWPVVPDGLTELLTGLDARYGAALPPVWITENGCSQTDLPSEGGEIRDEARIDYLRTHIEAVETAHARGVDVRGYFTWSLLDNFEWAEGYHQRFGLVHVDYATQRRTPKASYHWYREHIARARRTAP